MLLWGRLVFTGRSGRVTLWGFQRVGDHGGEKQVFNKYKDSSYAAFYPRLHATIYIIAPALTQEASHDR